MRRLMMTAAFALLTTTAHSADARIATKDDIGALVIATHTAYGCNDELDALMLVVNEMEDHSHEVAELERSGRCQPIPFGTVLRGSAPIAWTACLTRGAPPPCLHIRKKDVTRLTN